jgi:hypothetical protein
MGLNLPHNFIIAIDVDEKDVFVATAKGLAWGIGEGYYPGLRERPRMLAENRRDGK